MQPQNNPLPAPSAPNEPIPTQPYHPPGAVFDANPILPVGQPTPPTAQMPVTPPQDPMGQPPVVGNLFSPDRPLPPPRKRSRLKIFLVMVVFLVVLAGLPAAYYFGYYMSPGLIWKQSLSNTSKGYSQLITQINKQGENNYTGSKTKGELTIKANDATYSGSLDQQTAGSNSTTSFKVGLGVTKLDLEARTIQAAAGTSPDIFLRVSGFKGLVNSGAYGVSQPAFDSLDGQWIVVSHTLIDAITAKQASQVAAAKPKLTRQDVYTSAQQFGAVNAQYIFTSNRAKSVTTIVKKYGFETVDGHKTYHYKVGFVKQNVKSYLAALRDSFKQSPVGNWATKQTGQSTDAIMGYDSLQSSADKIKSSDTIDVWVNASNRVLYKVRISDRTNPATSFVDLGLNYTKPGSYPFFITGHAGTGKDASTLAITATMESQAHSVTGTLNYDQASVKVTGKAVFQPTNEKLSVTAPTGAISLQDAMNRLGLSEEYNALLNSFATHNDTGGDPTINSLTSVFSLVQI